MHITKKTTLYYYAGGGKGVGYKCDGAGGNASDTNSEDDNDDAIIVNGASENKNNDNEKMMDESSNLPNGHISEEHNDQNNGFFSPDENSVHSIHSNQSSEAANFEILKTGSIEWMKCSRQISQQFNLTRMKAIASATANDALRVGQVAWIDYSGEHFACKITSVRLSSYHSVEYQVFCPSLPEHCKHDFVPASRICDFIDDGYVEKKLKKNTKKTTTPKMKKNTKKSPRKSAWASGKIRSRNHSAKNTNNNEISQSEPDNNEMNKSLPVSNPLSSVINLEFNSNPLPERRTSNRIQTNNNEDSSNNKLIVPEQACNEFLSDLINQCVYRQLDLPQLEKLYSKLSFVINKHKMDWDRTNCFNEMRQTAIDYFK